MPFLITSSSFLCDQPEGMEGDRRAECNEKPGFLDSEADIS